MKLASLGEVRTLVSMVERWAQVGEPTPRAQLAQIRGLIDLCMMDRAWTRLQAFPDGDTWRRERMALTARMFLERGWPRRARKVLDEALAAWPEDAELRQMSDAANGPERRAPSHEPDPDAPLDEQLSFAEAWLATGAFNRAQRLLEHLVRRYPTERRPADLLWALRGEYDLQGGTLQTLAAQHGGSALAFDLPDLPEETEVTDLERARARIGVLDAGAGAFPDLFGAHGEPADPPTEEESAEVTQATRIADLFPTERPGGHLNGSDGDEDTQVLRVVERRIEPVQRAAAHQRAEGPPSQPGIADELEGEDDAVVQLTRPAERQPPPELKRAPRLPDPGPRRRQAPLPELQPEPVELEVEPDAAPAWWGPALGALVLGGLALGALAAWTAGLFG